MKEVHWRFAKNLRDTTNMTYDEISDKVVETFGEDYRYSPARLSVSLKYKTWEERCNEGSHKSYKTNNEISNNEISNNDNPMSKIICLLSEQNKILNKLCTIWSD